MHTASRKFAALAGVIGLSALGVVSIPLSASAAPLTVTSSADAGAGSLRSVIAGSASGDVITFAPGVTAINLASSIDIDWGLTIDGGGAVKIGRAVVGNYNQFAFTPESAGQSITIRGLEFAGLALSTGAAIYAGYGTNINQPNDVTLDGLYVHDQASNSGGGAFYIYAGLGDISITDSTFQNNNSNALPFGPGAISIDHVAGDVDIYDSAFIDNSTGLVGGAIWVHNIGTHNVTVNSTDFLDNSAASDGGAIRVVNAGGLVVSDGSTFTKNVSTVGNGGAISVQNAASVYIAESQLGGNVADISGGAVHLDNVDSFDFVDSTFTANTAQTGGAVYAGDVLLDSSVRGVTFQSNESTASDSDGGGALAVRRIGPGATVSVFASSFLDNLAYQGGGISVQETNAAANSRLSIENSTFARNGVGGDFGSSIFIRNHLGDFAMVNSTVDDGAGSAEFAIVFGTVDDSGSGTSIQVLHSTVVGNGGIDIGEGVSGFVLLSHAIIDGALLIEDNDDIVWNTTWSLLSGAKTAEINDLGHTTFSVANMKLGALADNGGPTLTRLPTESSPAHNGGDPALIFDDTTYDQRGFGFLRQVQAIDIGAVEVQTITLAATGATINILIPIIGGALLLAGIAAIVITQVRRRKGPARHASAVETGVAKLDE